MHSNSFLTEQNAKEIKHLLYSGDTTQATIATDFLVSQSTISRIARGVDWPDVEWPSGQVGPFPMERVYELRKRRYGRTKLKQAMQSSGLAKEAAEKLLEKSLPTVSEDALLDAATKKPSRQKKPK
jgi:predicted transcriptional regulator